MIVKTPLQKKRSGKQSRRAGKGRNGRSPSAKHHVYGRRKKNGSGRKGLSLPKVEPWKIIVGAVGLGILGVLYLNHVFATQKLLGEVQQLQREYNQARRAHADYRLTYDRLVGPSEIYKKAKEHGFINGGPADKVIEVKRNP